MWEKAKLADMEVPFLIIEGKMVWKKIAAPEK